MFGLPSWVCPTVTLRPVGLLPNSVRFHFSLVAPFVVLVVDTGHVLWQFASPFVVVEGVC